MYLQLCHLGHSCIVATLLLSHILSNVKGVPSTYGREFVFPVPGCSVDHRPVLLVSAPQSGVITQLVVRGLFTEILHTTIVSFKRFNLPCRTLATSAITRSGAISVTSSDDVMLHVMYQSDNFIVYPVSSLGSNYTVLVPSVTNSSSSRDTYVAFTSVSTQTAVTIEARDQTLLQYGSRNYSSNDLLTLTLHKSDVGVVRCLSSTCHLYIKGTLPIFVVVWSTSSENQSDIFIEQIRPDTTMGLQYILPLPEWAENDIQLGIHSEPNDTSVTIETDEQTEVVNANDGNILVQVSATNYLHLTSTSPFSVMFLLRYGVQNSSFSLISGVPVSQYLPLVCDFSNKHQGFTSVAFEQYIEEDFNSTSDNSSDVPISYESTVGYVILKNSLLSSSVPELLVSRLKTVLGAHSFYSYILDSGLEQFVAGGSQLNVCPFQGELDTNSSLCNISNTTFVVNEYQNATTDIFDFLGCVSPVTSNIDSWLRGSPKETGMTASVIAVIISIVVAVIGVIGFIIGLMVIDLTDDQRPSRQTRVVPIEDDPPPPQD